MPVQFLSTTPTGREIRQARTRSTAPGPVNITELVGHLAQDPLISKDKAVETLQRYLQSVPADQFLQTLIQIEVEIDRVNFSLQTLKDAVIELMSPHDKRKEKNLKKLEALWQGTEYLPSQYKPRTLSQDLVYELYLLSKDVARRRIPLHTLWEDNEEHSISLPRLIRQKNSRHKGSFLTVKVVRDARAKLGALPAHGQKGGNTAEDTSSLSEPEIELARHAPLPLANQSTLWDPSEDLMPCTFPPHDGARNETFLERSLFDYNDEGSSPARKRKREFPSEHPGKRSPRPSLDNSLIPNQLPSPSAASTPELGLLPTSITPDNKNSPCISLTLCDEDVIKDIPLTSLRNGRRSIYNNKRLNDDAINPLIHRCRRPGIWTVDSFAIESHKRNHANNINPLPRRRRDRATNFRDNTVLIPFFDKPRAHWLLLSVDISRARVDVYDSLTSPIHEESGIRSLLVDLCQDQSLTSPENLKFHYQPCPQQSNDKDCGVFVVAVATKLAENTKLPSSWNVEQLRKDFATHLCSSGYAAPQGFRNYEAPHLKPPAARSVDSLPLVAENPFQRWFEGIDIQKARCAIHGSALVMLQSRHQSCLADLDGFEIECHRIEKDIKVLIGDMFTLSQGMITPSSQLVDLERELLRRVDVVTEGVRTQTELQDKRDAILSLVPSRLLQIKTMIILCHIFGRRFVVAKYRLDRMEILQNGFLANATRLLEES